MIRFATSCLDIERGKDEGYTPLFDASNELLEQELKKELKLPSISDVKEEKRIVEGPRKIFGSLLDEIIGKVLPLEQNELLK